MINDLIEQFCQNKEITDPFLISLISPLVTGAESLKHFETLFGTLLSSIKNYCVIPYHRIDFVLNSLLPLVTTSN